MADGERSVRIDQLGDYKVAITWDPGRPPLVADEPPPMGRGEGPSPGQLLLGAVGNCMTDSLLFALRKFKQSPEPIQCEVASEKGRNAQGRLRIARLTVTLTLGVPAETVQHLDRVLAQFEEFCTVGASVAQAIPTEVHVKDATGKTLK